VWGGSEEEEPSASYSKNDRTGKEGVYSSRFSWIYRKRIIALSERPVHDPGLHLPSGGQKNANDREGILAQTSNANGSTESI